MSFSTIAATAFPLKTAHVISLADLPTELLCQIASYLASPDLASLARGCKSLYQITIRILYTNVTTRSFAQLQLIGQKFAADPSLVRCPKQITARAFDITPRVLDERPFPILREMFKAEMPFLKVLVLEEGDVGCENSPEPPESQEIIEGILSQPSLKQFSYARYLHQSNEYGSMTQMMRVLRHPSARVITFKWTIPTSQAIMEHAQHDAQPARPLHLRFWHCNLEPDQLRTIISEINYLSAFSFYQDYWLDYGTTGLRIADIKHYVNALKPAAHTLESLTLLYDVQWGLAEFVKLKYLRVGPRFLVKCGILDSPQDFKRRMPPYLEHFALELVNMRDWDFWPVTETIELKELVFPHLKRFTIHVLAPTEPEQLIKAAENVGLNIQFAPCFFDKDWLDEDWSSEAWP